MLEFRPKESEFAKVDTSDLRSEGLLERYDLQSAAISSWHLFRNEIGLPEAYLIGQELNPHPDTRDAIDILAYDSNMDALVVIELKRGKNKLHLLQAISYAAMVSQWEPDHARALLNPDDGDYDDASDQLSNGSLQGEPRIVLVGESFDPQVILTADWLCTNYGLDIRAFSIEIFATSEKTFLSAQQRFPLQALEDSYVSRGPRAASTKNSMDSDWSDVLPTLQYPFAKRALDLCQRLTPGEPARRRFRSIKKKFDDLDWVTVSFRRKYLNIYIGGALDDPEKYFADKLPSSVEIGRWQKGYSFNIRTDEEFERLVRWLDLDKAVG